MIKSKVEDILKNETERAKLGNAYEQMVDKAKKYRCKQALSSFDTWIESLYKDLVPFLEKVMKDEDVATIDFRSDIAGILMEKDKAKAFKKYMEIAPLVAKKAKPLCETMKETDKWNGIEECKGEKYASCCCMYPIYLIDADVVEILNKIIDKTKEFANASDEKRNGNKGNGNGKGDSKEKNLARYRNDLEGNNEKIEKMKKEKGECIAKIDEIKKSPYYREELKEEYALADSLFECLKNDNSMRQELVLMHIPQKDEEGLRILRNAFLDYCAKNGKDTASFFRGIYTGNLDTRDAVSGIGRALEGGYSKHVSISKEEEHIAAYDSQITELECENNELRNRIELVNQGTSNGEA